jgi:hypothetical protein
MAGASRKKLHTDPTGLRQLLDELKVRNYKVSERETRRRNNGGVKIKPF